MSKRIFLPLMICTLACGPAAEGGTAGDEPDTQTSDATTGGSASADTTTGQSTDPTGPGTSVSTTGPTCPNGDCGDDDPDDECATDDCDRYETTGGELTCDALGCPAGSVCVSWTEVEDTDGGSTHWLSCETIPDRCQALGGEDFGACLVRGICEAQGYCAERYPLTEPHLACFTDPGCF